MGNQKAPKSSTVLGRHGRQQGVGGGMVACNVLLAAKYIDLHLKQPEPARQMCCDKRWET